MTFDKLIDNITQWADDKGILVSDNIPQQTMKVMEELGETAGAILKQKKTEDVIDGIGDILVTVIILSKQLGLEPTECLESAWNEIKDRKRKQPTKCVQQRRCDLGMVRGVCYCKG